MSNQLYNPDHDPYFSEPYLDVEEWRDTPVRHYYVHGGFKGTDIDGANEVRFCFYFPEKENYDGRFFQYVSPAPEDEHESEHLKGADDKISFCLTHGAYYVVSNQGGFVVGHDPSRLYKASSASAQLSRKIAKKLYGTEERPFGYIFGGSGGSFKTMGAMEATEGIWDGAVPYVMANPMAVPNVFASRMHAVRLLGEEGLERVTAAMEPGGSGDIYEGLDDLQKAALKEASMMGFPDRAWFCHPFMGDGALMVLVPTVYAMFPNYFTDFWTKEGYEGVDPNGDAARDRMQHVTTVADILYEEKKPAAEGEEFTSVDNSWVNTMLGGEPLPKIVMKDLVPEGAYQFHCRLRVLSGECKGAEINIDTIDGAVLTLHPENNGAENKNPFKALKAGDQIMVDNSDAIAMQFFHRHQIPDASYKVYDQFRDEEGKPIPAQLPMLVSPFIATSGAGILIDGNIHGKVIGLCSVLDESACPWHGDWYKGAVARHGKADDFRLYYHDNSIHDDRTTLEDQQHQVDYLGTLHQALLDVAAWAEKGIEPLPTMNYKFEEGQITLPVHAADRGGMQPVPFACVKGARDASFGKVAEAAVGEPVRFEAVIEMPPHAGSVTGAAWDYECANDWSHEEELLPQADGTVKVVSTHVFNKPGVYYPCLKVRSNRKGDAADIFTQCKNLDRVKVVVE